MANTYTSVSTVQVIYAFDKIIHYSLSLHMYCLLCVVLNNYVIKQIAVKSIHKLILFIEQK